MDIEDTLERPRDIQEYPSDICAVSDRGHRKSALRSDGSHWGSYLAVGRYGRGRAARSIRSGIVGIQSRWSICSDATKPDRISGSTTLSRELIRDHDSVRHCEYGAHSCGASVSKKRVQNRCVGRRALSEQKPGTSPKGRPSNFRKNAHVAGIWLVRDDTSLLPCIRVAMGSWDTSRATYKYQWASSPSHPLVPLSLAEILQTYRGKCQGKRAVIYFSINIFHPILLRIHDCAIVMRTTDIHSYVWKLKQNADDYTNKILGFESWSNVIGAPI